MGKGSKALAALTTTSAPGSNPMLSSYTNCSGPIKADIWDVSAVDGAMRVIWENKDGCTYVLTAAVLPEKKRIFFTSNYESCCVKSESEYFKAQLFFEPT